MQQRIRAAMANDEGDLIAGSPVEARTKTYVGGKPRYKNNEQDKREDCGASGKTSVVGAVQREGDVKASK